MSPKKTGRIFIILMIALTAYGFGSAMHAFGLAQDFGTDLLPADLYMGNVQQISEISDPAFVPITLNKRIIVINTTNNTNGTRNNSSNTSRG